MRMRMSESESESKKMSKVGDGWRIWDSRVG